MTRDAYIGHYRQRFRPPEPIFRRKAGGVELNMMKSPVLKCACRTTHWASVSCQLRARAEQALDGALAGQSLNNNSGAIEGLAAGSAPRWTPDDIERCRFFGDFGQRTRQRRHRDQLLFIRNQRTPDHPDVSTPSRPTPVQFIAANNLILSM